MNWARKPIGLMLNHTLRVDKVICWLWGCWIQPCGRTSSLHSGVFFWTVLIRLLISHWTSLKRPSLIKHGVGLLEINFYSVHSLTNEMASSILFRLFSK